MLGRQAVLRLVATQSRASSTEAIFRIKTFNAISPVGLAKFPEKKYAVAPGAEGAHAILLRSHQVQEEDVNLECRAIARCGAGTNNCNVPRMSELGIPVFNTPGANANSVKELVLCAMFLASRGIVEGANHMQKLHSEGTAKERVEKDKKMFGGQEIFGKTLGVVGTGAIGAAVSEAALALGMKVVGYDPALSVEGALRLPGREMQMKEDLSDLLKEADYVSIHAPYIKDATHHMLNRENLVNLKKNCHILNFARGELVDADALKALYADGFTGKYICDFPVDEMWDHPKCIVIPHLGASTEEAEENSAAMAADTIKAFLETGTIRNSVNFPTTVLPTRGDTAVRITIVNKNEKGVLASINDLLAKHDLNVLQQINTSRGPISYNVVDVERTGILADITEPEDVDELRAGLTALPHVLSTRLILGESNNASGYARKIDGKVHL